MAKLVTSSKPVSGAVGFYHAAYLNDRIAVFYNLGTPTISATVVSLVFDAQNNIIFTGTGFAGNPVAGFTAGTITSISMRRLGNEDFKITGLSLSAQDYFDFAKANPSQPLLALALVGNDTILGTERDDRLFGLTGNDVIRSGVGRDYLDGGDGNDILAPGIGVDGVVGGNGIDTVDYASSTRGVRVDLALTGVQIGASDESGDRLQGIENATGSRAAGDTLSGDGARNTLRGLGGNDKLTGRGGSDFLDGGAGKDDLNGDAGNDTTSYATSNARVTVDLRKTTAQSGGYAQGDTLSSIENVIGSNFADKLTGTNGANVIRGLKGADIMSGLGGVDTVSYAGSSKGVQVDLRKTTAQAGGDAAGDKISSFENVIGSSHADVLRGTTGKNVLEGGKGADKLIGGTGIDTASYASSSKAVWVSIGFAAVSLFTGDAVGDTFSSIENITGSRFGDQIFGSDGANVLSGGAGNDTLNGGLGNDTHFGGTGDDAFDYRYLNVFGLERDGKDIIADFKAGAASGDQLRFITDAVPQTFAGAMGIATQVGANTVFTFDANNTLTLLNVQKSLISSDDILFFGLN